VPRCSGQEHAEGSPCPVRHGLDPSSQAPAAHTGILVSREPVLRHAAAVHGHRDGVCASSECVEVTAVLDRVGQFDHEAAAMEVHNAIVVGRYMRTEVGGEVDGDIYRNNISLGQNKSTVLLSTRDHRWR
jgi:hypothetical protein